MFMTTISLASLFLLAIPYPQYHRPLLGFPSIDFDLVDYIIGNRSVLGFLLRDSFRAEAQRPSYTVFKSLFPLSWVEAETVEWEQTFGQQYSCMLKELILIPLGISSHCFPEIITRRKNC